MDRIGPYSFVRLDSRPQRVAAQWEISARAGINGVGLWNSGVRGEPFVLTSEAVALTYDIGSTFLQDYKQLELYGPVPIACSVAEQGMLYKVLQVRWRPPGVKAFPRIHLANDPTWYTALVWAEWLLLPLDPFIQQP
jgi:hypothetical protein